ncbi:uncharacterized protein LOC130159095 isoform X3 [Falco biarmicus]|uniref:uncharacterized protein LOC119157705 isoform X3 n=1 Tax=Falco rusticolus TaxID=120794 RepID=UPI0018867826|nr:uncharacterized protein LOC119157705 isoform X3 [Falco rusticolus]XP_056216307.1 uncharacterized protein LOC130159095 isoform X3 [Falco biarmicus]
MEVQLASGFLPLLLLAWLPAGLSHQISATIDVSVGLDLILQCLLQAGSNSTARGVKWFNTTQNNGEKQNEDGVEMKNGSAQLVFPSVNKAHSGMYTCRMENMRNTSRNKDSKLNTHGTVASQPRESVITTECRFKIWSENLTVHVKWYRPAGLEVGNQTDTIVLGENCANLTSPGMHAASTGICGCRVFITRVNLTDTGNGTQGTVPSCSPGAPQAKGTWIETWAGLNFPLCIISSLAVATLLYMLVIGLLVWRCRRNRKGKITSRQVVEMDQLRMASSVTGTEDLTYANLKFEKKGAKPASSDVVYTEIKPSQQKQCGRDAGAASAGMVISPKGEDK